MKITDFCIEYSEGQCELTDSTTTREQCAECLKKQGISELDLNEMLDFFKNCDNLIETPENEP